MKLAEFSQRSVLSRLAFSSMALILIASSVNYAGAITEATADKTNPAGTTINGDTIKNKDLDTCKNKAKTNAEENASDACTNFCKPAKVKHYGSGDASEPTVSGPDASGKYHCTSSIAVKECECHPEHTALAVDARVLLDPISQF